MTQEQTSKQGKPWPVIIMLSMLLFVFIAGYVLSPRTEDGKLWWVDILGTTNHGILLNPVVELSDGDLLTESGVQWPAMNNSTFKLVVINRGSCEQRCQDMLHSTRQLHVRLNRDYKDVERGYLFMDASVEAATEAISEWPDYSLLKLGNTRLVDGLAATDISISDESPILLLINPINIGMLVYTAEHSGSEVLEDLEHVLELAR